MKNSFKLWLILAVIGLIGLAFFACDDKDKPCSHTWGEWTNISLEPTCVDTGTGKRICTGCGVTDTNTAIPEDPDAHISDNAKVADCTVSNKCTNCHYDFEDAGNHNYPATTAATCTADSIPQPCSTCSEPNPEQVVDAFGHENNAWNWTTYNSTTGQVSCTRSGCSGGFAKMGDTGPGAGIIFYVVEEGFNFFTGTTADDNTTVKRFYLEASPANLTGGTGTQSTMRWSTADDAPYPTVAGAAIQALIGNGSRSTALIIAAETATYPGNTYIYAARAAHEYRGGSLSDWFLPSADELDAMYIARAAPNNVAGLPTGGYFWSSTRHGSNDTYVHTKFFGNGTKYVELKNTTTQNVRAVRAF
jgi:hypothetical protein